MDQYVPLTAIDNDVPCLLIDRLVPLDVLHANAAERVRTATQMLESLSKVTAHGLDDADLSYFSHAAAVLLRDGCDLLDVLGWRLRTD